VTAPYPHRPSVPRWSWLLVVAGWALIVPAFAGALLYAGQFALVAVPGVVIVGAGAFFLSRRSMSLVVPACLFGGFFLLVGILTSAEALANNLWGTTASCQVDSVHQQVRTQTTHTHDSRGREQTRTETRTYYAHQITCPDGRYWVDGSRPYPVGGRTEVLFDPRTHSPRFTDGNRHQSIGGGAVLLSVGGVIVVLLPFIALRLGRRRVAQPLPPTGPPYGPPAGPPYGPPAGPPFEGSPPPYETWQQQSGSAPVNPAPVNPAPVNPAPVYPAAASGPRVPPQPVPIDSPDFERAVRQSPSFQTASPGVRMMLPFGTWLLRRRMKVPPPPPPNPLADRPEYRPPRDQ
jgi:hypothetical protein